MKVEVIETKRLILKGFSPENMTDLFENYSKEEIKETLGHRSEEEYLKEEMKQKNGYASYNRRFMLFLLQDKSSGKIIGRCGLHNWFPDHKRAEVGYSMEEEPFKRLGLMSEALEAVIDFGFNQLNLNRIEALVGTGNTASLRLMEKNNFIREGVLRQHYFISDKYEDSVLFSKLLEEYLREKNEPDKPTQMHTIIPFEEHYLPEIETLMTEIQEEFDTPFRSQNPTPISEYVEAGNRFWIALRGNRVVGTIALTHFDEQTGIARNMFVSKEARGKQSGVAKELLNTLLAEAKRLDYKAVYLGTMTQFKAAQKFYSRNGFIRIPPTDLPENMSFNPVDDLFYVLNDVKSR